MAPGKAYLFVTPGKQETFERGLRRLGYQVMIGAVSPRCGPCDIAVVWNLHGRRGQLAALVKARGGRVVVVENGYCGQDDDGYQYIAMALDAHLGAGRWFPKPDASRWQKLGLVPAPWRTGGGHILICASRGIGGPATAMPRDWPVSIVRRLGAVTDRPLKLRPHPRTQPNAALPALEDDLAQAHAVVVWGSAAGVQALLAGVPVFHDHPSWIMAPAASGKIEDIERPFLGERDPAFVRLSWAQWTLAEIASGAPFAHLLEH